MVGYSRVPSGGTGAGAETDSGCPARLESRLEAPMGGRFLLEMLVQGEAQEVLPAQPAV